MIQIQESAIFIADSHYPHHDSPLLDTLKKIEVNSIQTTQLFLIGDNFDFLFGYNDYVQTFVKDAIDIIKRLSDTIDIYYFEGNHDFCLQPIFPKIKIYNRQIQPIIFGLNGQRVAISHGDKYATSLIYDIYSTIFRTRFIITILRPWERYIIDYMMNRLSQKNICHNFDKFEQRVEKILKHYEDVDLVIEGHFHQGKILGKYISLPSQICQDQIGIIENGKMIFKNNI